MEAADSTDHHAGETPTQRLRRLMPLVGATGIVVDRADAEAVALTMPLGPNLNHQGTAFGGSLSVAGIVAGWLLVDTRAGSGGLAVEVVIAESKTRFVRPVVGELSAQAAWDSPDPWPAVLPVFERAGRARVAVRSELHCGGKVCAVHDGVYVVQRT